jgi:hypothetical protein
MEGSGQQDICDLWKLNLILDKYGLLYTWTGNRRNKFKPSSQWIDSPGNNIIDIVYQMSIGKLERILMMVYVVQNS